uniref:Uncharacterized protein n=1 Tax=Clytia hemisphaerica TaxID=252671 RepID=A0A7M5UYX6_9CNID
MASSQIVLVVRSQRLTLGVNETNVASMRSIFAGNLERVSSSLLQRNSPSMERISNSIMRMVDSSHLQPPNNSLNIGNGSRQQLLTYVASQHTVSWRNAESHLAINDAETSELQLQHSSNQDNIRVSLRESFSDGDNITFLFILYLFFHCEETNHDSMLYDENDESIIQQLQSRTSEEVPEEVKAVSDELITSSQSHLIRDDAIEASSDVIKKTDDIQVLR